MTRFFIAFIFLFSLFNTVVAQVAQPYFQQQVNHNLNVNYNEVNNSFKAQQQITYTNNSKDSLPFIIFHIWLNAFKNDKSFYTKQTIENDELDFYFSSEKDKGYINKLNFKVGNQTCNILPYQNYNDIIKVMLPKPIAPNATIIIENSFEAKLPKIFSRGGASGSLIALTQWYPKPAVYNYQGWHPMPYAELGEYFNEFGNYELNIDLPKNFVVAGAGLQNNAYNEPNQQLPEIEKLISKKKSINDKQKIIDSYIQPSLERKQMTFKTTNVTDIAIFIDKNFICDTGSVILPSGKTISLFCYYQPWQKVYTNAINMMQKSILFYSAEVGDYPHNTAIVVDGGQFVSGGMEYPAITLLGVPYYEKDLDILIAHELGHNWFQGALANNERRYPFLDEGFNSYIESKYTKTYYPKQQKKNFVQKRFVNSMDSLAVVSLEKLGLSQPINTASENFTALNYGAIAYLKTSIWLKNIEQKIGAENMKNAIQTYWTKYNNKHVEPTDFINILKQKSQINIDENINKLTENQIFKDATNKKLKFSLLFNFNNTHKYHYVSALPYLGLNVHDGLQLGLIFHNYQLPLSKFNFLIAPAFGTKSKALIGTAYLKYTPKPLQNNWHPSIDLNIKKYTSQNFINPIFGKLNYGYHFIKPALHFFKMPSNKRSSQYQKLSFIYNAITEGDLAIGYDSIFRPPVDTLVTPKVSAINSNRNFATINYTIWNERALYPFSINLKADITNAIVRTAAVYNQFFNYNSIGEGLNVRIFAGKMFYYKNKNLDNQRAAAPYNYSLNAPVGAQDYNYENYFLGRGAYPGFGGGANTAISNIASQQIIQRDGAFKFRTPLLGSNDGYTDNWMIAINLSSAIPNSINPLMKLPIKIPLKVFLDVGTYAEKWNRSNIGGNKIIANGGFELSILKNFITIYMPLFYGNIYKEYTKSTVIEKKFLRNMSFILNLKKIKNLLPYKIATPVFK